MKCLKRHPSNLTPPNTRLNSTTDELLKNPCFSPQTLNHLQNTSTRFLKSLGIHGLAYAKAFDDGRVVMLYSYPSISEFVIKNKVPLTSGLPPQKSLSLSSKVWNCPDPNGLSERYFRALHDISDLKSFGNFIDRNASYYENFSFLSQNDPQRLVNDLINSKEKLEAFTLQFRDQFAPLIQSLESTPLLLPSEMRPELSLKVRSQNNLFQNEISPPPFIHVNTNKINDSGLLSSRERQCLSLYLSGYGLKESGSHLGLSARTIEHHLERIRDKFFLSSIRELRKLTQGQSHLK